MENEVEELTTEDCLDYRPDEPSRCRGPVEYHSLDPGFAKSFPRCEKHWEARLNEQERIDRTYGARSDAPPSWFKGSWGGENEFGERWDDDY